MADVLLTHSYHLPYDAKQLRKMQPYMPLGTLYAASALREHGLSVAVFDAMLQSPEEGFAHILRQQQPTVVVIYEDDFNFLSKMCLTRMREVAWGIVSAARHSGATVVVHGSDSTDNPQLFLSSGCDYVLCGEAEATLSALCAAILQGKEPPDLDGVIHADSYGNLYRNPSPLAKNPFWASLSPARDLIDMEPYRTAWQSAHGYFSANIVASRGCPFHCNWCAKPISANRFQLRPASSVAEEMASLKQNGVEHIWFGDDVFALNRHWVKEFASEVIGQDAVLPFKVQSRADLMHADVVENLRQAGCAEVWMGVESGSQAILDAMEKGVTLSTIVSARARLRDAGIRACFFLQFGYPGESWKELQETIAFVRENRPDDIGISFSYPLPGTVFYERVHAQLGTKRNWSDSDDLCIMFHAAYSTDFYRVVREALHAEVDSWHQASSAEVNALWQRVADLEAGSRNPEPLLLSESLRSITTSSFVPIEQLTGSPAGEATN